MVTHWYRGFMENEYQQSKQEPRLYVSLCFHPKVTRGPTVQKLLTHLRSEVDEYDGGEDMDTIVSNRKRRGLRGLFRSRRKYEKIIKHNHRQQVVRRAKGTFTFTLRGIHLCGSQCSRLDGHCTISYPDYPPIVNINKRFKLVLQNVIRLF